MSYTNEEKEKTEELLSTAVDNILEGIDKFNVAANTQIKSNDYTENYENELNEWRIKFNKLQLKLIKFKDLHIV
jgi:hypothetical protein